MDRNKLIFWISTGLLSILMLFSAGMYFTNYDTISEAVTGLGYPAFIIYPLGTAKILGLIAIWSRLSHTLKEWAYAGFFFDTALATQAHLMAQDGAHIPAMVGLVLVLVSYWAGNKVFQD